MDKKQRRKSSSTKESGDQSGKTQDKPRRKSSSGKSHRKSSTGSKKGDSAATQKLTSTVPDQDQPIAHSRDRVAGSPTNVVRVVKGDKLFAWISSHALIAEGSLDLASLTTEDFVQKFVKAVTSPGERLFDLLPSDAKQEIPVDSCDEKYVFVSHFWRRPVFELFNYINHTSLWFWVDIVCVMQHKGEHQQSDLASIRVVVQKAKEFWAMLDQQVRLFTRCWCCYEVTNRLLTDKQVHFEYPEALVSLGIVGKPEEEWNLEQSRAYCNSQLELLRIMKDKGVDVQKCEALYEQDRLDILEWMSSELGFENVNDLIVKNLVKRISELQTTVQFLS